jgi:predicted aspartyl protease
MGRIVTSVNLKNVVEPDKSIRFDALVDTGATYLVLPEAWENRLGKFESVREVKLQNARQQPVSGKLCGPAKIRIEGFDYIYNEVLFLKMEPEDGEYEPLVGYIVLEQCGAAVDMLGHRLVPVKYLDLK